MQPILHTKEANRHYSGWLQQGAVLYVFQHGWTWQLTLPPLGRIHVAVGLVLNKFLVYLLDRGVHVILI